MFEIQYYKKVGRKEYTEFYKIVFSKEELVEAINLCPLDLDYKVINK